jgi:ribosome-associated protein
MNDPEEPTESTESGKKALDDATASRTQRKRAALDLQNLGKRLVELDAGDLATVPVPPELDEAIGLWRRIRSHEAKRRQLQFIGKLMRRIDLEPIEAALDRIDGSSAEARYAFRQLETWRDRLLGEDRALTEYLDQHPHADRQALRHQIARVRKAADEAQQRAQARALFRLLRSFAEEA